MELKDVYSQLVKISRPSLVSAPPTEGIGTIRSTEGGPRFEDDGLSSDDGESETEDEDDDLHVPVSSFTTPSRWHLNSPGFGTRFNNLCLSLPQNQVRHPWLPR